MSNEDCTFCSIVSGDLPCSKVAEDERTLAFMDLDPGSEGHLLVIPKRHSPDLFTITPDDLVATTLAAQRIAPAALTALGADGLNLFHCSGSAAWQTVLHFHLHVIPRYRDRSKEKLELMFAPGSPSDPDRLAEQARLLAAEL